MKRHNAYNEAFWSVITQIIVIIIFALLLLTVGGAQIAGSYALGGLICVLPNIYLYRRVFEHFGARAAKRIVKAFYWGEAVKLFLVGMGFAGALLLSWVHPLWLFTGFIVTQLSFWLAPIFLGFRRLKK